DGDGHLDLFLANEVSANRLYRNDGDGTFTDVTDVAGVGDMGVGKGVALPHGLSESVSDVVLVMGISPDGIDFNAVDGALCHIFVLLISPARQPDRHLKILGRLSKLLKDGELRTALVEAHTPDEVLQTLHEREAGQEDIPI
ncbi:MAG: PTS sugar transporter subunit IIA, partial [Fidelibacterota bacterium]